MKKTASILTIALLIMSIQAYAGSLTVESDSQEFKDTEHKIYL